ncbi:MAG: hypothetical protein HQK99_02380 [Nitrospirae bacterium]|nr:hypothetical protein [Nitrospirota bacterium]
MSDFNCKLEPNPQGRLKIWEKPMSGHPYVIGADVAEGLEHGDFSPLLPPGFNEGGQDVDVGDAHTLQTPKDAQIPASTTADISHYEAKIKEHEQLKERQDNRIRELEEQYKKTAANQVGDWRDKGQFLKTSAPDAISI